MEPQYIVLLTYRTYFLVFTMMLTFFFRRVVVTFIVRDWYRVYYINNSLNGYIFEYKALSS